MQTQISIPLDSDGFLRRECPTCEREFKWLPSGEGDESTEDNASNIDPAGYFCPYCGVQAAPGAWLTKAQVSLVHHVARREFVEPMLRDWASDMERKSTKHVKFKANRNFGDDSSEPQLTEADDMRRIDFECHTAEPLKVLDEWDGPVLCLICGNAA
jgi:hypothetical protein